MSIPLRYGTTKQTHQMTNVSSECQFLLGTVQRTEIAENETFYQGMCQFLLGTVQQKWNV